MPKKSAPIPWATLRTAHGTAGHIPEALVRLTSSDSDVRREAYWKIDNYVVLQGDLYEAAPFVALELIDMLRNDASYGRDLIYELLYEIANGYAPGDYHVKLADGREMPLMKASRTFVESGLDVYAPDLVGSPSAVRRQLIDLLSSFASKTEDVHRILLSARNTTTDPVELADLDRALEELDGS
jgi:hypothetical protein